MASTTSFNWETPDDTDLVKDGAAAIRTLGNSIDTSMTDLLGGTTGQVLSKTSGTDMAFTWVDTDDTNAIQNSIVDAKGDLIAASAADTPARLAVGADGETLVADSSTATGLRYNPTVEAGKNRIINGAMTIDQRNSGAAVTINTNNPPIYVLDRFANLGQIADGVYTVQQDTTAPSGFSNSLKATVTTADASIGADQFYLLQHRIEGYNIADFAFGTAAAKTVTLSFWVRSSVTGTFGGSLRNSASNRSYPYSYAINTADTWEKKSVVIAGDTTGTWLNTTNLGLTINWSLGDGANRLGTAGAWAAASYTGVTSQTNLIATSGATWFITGVQLELGSVATSFSNAGGTIQGELAACQRYYYRETGGATYSPYGLGYSTTTTTGYALIKLPQTMRVKPTAVEFSSLAFNTGVGTVTALSAVTLDVVAPSVATIAMTTTSTWTSGVTGRLLNNNNAAGYIGFTAEL